MDGGLRFNRKAYAGLLAGADELGFKLRPVGASRWLTRGPGEDKLSDWMSRNAFVTWIEHPEPWVVEEKLICGENSAVDRSCAKTRE